MFILIYRRFRAENFGLAYRDLMLICWKCLFNTRMARRCQEYRYWYMLKLHYSVSGWISQGKSKNLILGRSCSIAGGFWCSGVATSHITVWFLFFLHSTRMPSVRGKTQTMNSGWLVVYVPLWTIFYNQFGWLFPIYGKIWKHVPVITNQMFISDRFWSLRDHKFGSGSAVIGHPDLSLY